MHASLRFCFTSKKGGNFSALNYYYADSKSSILWCIFLLTGLTLTHFCACLKPAPGFPTLYVVIFCCVLLTSVKMRGDCLFY